MTTKKQTVSKFNTWIGFIKANEDWFNLILGGLTLAIVVSITGWFIWNKFIKRTSPASPPQVVVENGQQTQTQSGQTEAKNVYIVKKGDYLWKIAINQYGNGYKWVEIAKANHLSNPDLLFRGQKLILPLLGSKTKSLSNSVEKPNSNPQTREYKVVIGDTLWSICQRYYQNPYLYLKLAKFNQIKNPNLIEVNQALKIPPLKKFKGSNKTNFKQP